LVNDPSGDGAAPARASRELRETQNGDFLDQSLKALRDLAGSGESAKLARMAVADPRTFDRLIDPGFFNLADAIGVARRLQAVDATTDIRLLRLLQPGRTAVPLDSWRTSRMLEVVSAITDGARIQTILPNLLRHTDPRVRSKAALLVGRFNPNWESLFERLGDGDCRVRANSVESIWGLSSSEACRMFLIATRDGNNRVAANGVVGLHMAGSLVAVRIVQKLARSEDPAFRAAGAWAMGEVKDPRFLPFLASMMEDPMSSVRRNTIRATVRIRKWLEELKKMDPLSVTASWQDGLLDAEVSTPTGVTLPELRPTCFVATNREAPLEIGSVTPDSRRYRIAVEKPADAQVRLCVYTADGMGEFAGL
jgi:hypothetical protein